MSVVKRCSLALLLAVSFAPISPAGAATDFVRDIRPILSDNCFKCHGPDDATLKSGLRLDSHAGATSPAKSGDPAIVPGQPDASELMRRVTADDPDDRMPPEDTGKTLSAEQIEKLRQWIAGGALYETHWAFEAVERPELPEARYPGWIRNPIDTECEHSVFQAVRAEVQPPRFHLRNTRRRDRGT
jgi:mono/diheme cytochrome c family protein